MKTKILITMLAFFVGTASAACNHESMMKMVNTYAEKAPKLEEKSPEGAKLIQEQIAKASASGNMETICKAYDKALMDMKFMYFID